MRAGEGQRLVPRAAPRPPSEKARTQVVKHTWCPAAGGTPLQPPLDRMCPTRTGMGKYGVNTFEGMSPRRIRPANYHHPWTACAPRGPECMYGENMVQQMLSISRP